MDEEYIKRLRTSVQIMFSPKHFWEEANNEKLFTSFEKAREITIKAIKNDGCITEPPDWRKVSDGCKFFCIFYSDTGKLVCCPIKHFKNTFFVPTIYSVHDKSWRRTVFENFKKSKTKIFEKK